MKIGLTSIKEFFALPEGKQFLAALILAIGTLCTVIMWQEAARVRLQKRLDECNHATVVLIQADDVILQAQKDRCEKEKLALLNSTIVDLQNRFDDKQKQLDAILAESYNILRNQKTTQQKLQNINRTVKHLKQ